MEKISRITERAVAIEQINVNTDQIFPARFLKNPRSVGYEQFLFHDLRFDEDGNKRENFPLNDPSVEGARIIVSDINFGCGSSREGAVYALQDAGFRCLIAPSFGDIFAANCIKNGVLPVRLPADVCEQLREQIRTNNGAPITIDLPSQTVELPSGEKQSFDIDPFAKQCLLKGLDEIGVTLESVAEIDGFEQQWRRKTPWLETSRT
jgi:3-isopropylmalate/(R)-2-methylmalate dehydratase small subunit